MQSNINEDDRKTPAGSVLVPGFGCNPGSPKTHNHLFTLKMRGLLWFSDWGGGTLLACDIRTYSSSGLWCSRVCSSSGGDGVDAVSQCRLL